MIGTIFPDRYTFPKAALDCRDALAKSCGSDAAETKITTVVLAEREACVLAEREACR
jgi:hypothetical protein